MHHAISPSKVRNALINTVVNVLTKETDASFSKIIENQLLQHMDWLKAYACTLHESDAARKTLLIRHARLQQMEFDDTVSKKSIIEEEETTKSILVSHYVSMISKLSLSFYDEIVFDSEAMTFQHSKFVAL
jgi:hypothetical protein